MGNLFSSVASGALGFAAKWKMYLIGAGVGLMLLGGAYGGGYLTGINHETHKEVIVAKREGAAVAASIEAHEAAASANRVVVKVRDIAREEQLQAQVDNLRSNSEKLQKVLDAKADPDPDCRVRLGDVRLLNAAAPERGILPADGVSDPASVAAYQEQTPSSITCRAFISDEIAVRTQYGELAAIHDKLVDWVQVELINPQLGKK
jgi:hypothetical protein